MANLKEQEWEKFADTRRQYQKDVFSFTAGWNAAVQAAAEIAEQLAAINAGYAETRDCFTRVASAVRKLAE